MHFQSLPLAAGLASRWTLDSICTTSTIQAYLPTSALVGVTIDTSSLIVEPLTNFAVGTTAYELCNVTFAYTHDGRNDQVLVNYFLPTPDSFQNRYLSTGGGGYAINSGATAPGTGLPYGAVTGRTDGGFGGFSVQYNTNGVDLLANGTLNYDTLFLFGYKAHHELSVLGKALTQNVYSPTKLYSYYQGCSEGGREGMSQIQRYADQWDGAVIGAPAFRFAFQQVNHLFAAIAEQTVGYVPPPCELSAIVNATIEACDPLDGRTDGVVSRTDLCMLQYNVTSAVGRAYSCPAGTVGGMGPGSVGTPVPAQSGTVSQQAADLVNTLYKGLHTSDGLRAYIYYTPSSTFDDAEASGYSNSTGWELPTGSLGVPFVSRSLHELEISTLPLTNVTYDTLAGWMYEGFQKFQDTLMTNWPDLTNYHSTKGKIIHYHGESDFSIPTASSVYYWNSVRKIMYPSQDYNTSVASLQDWYRLFLIPGAGHCAPSSTQPNGPFPETPLASLIQWVENGTVPDTLPATVSAGSYQGSQPLCAFPLRPFWNDSGTMSCVYDQSSIETWDYNLNAFDLPIY